MYAATLLHAGALPDPRSESSGCRKWMELTSTSMSAAPTGIRLNGVEIDGSPGNRARRPKDLADGISVAERGDQQSQARVIGQIRRATREGALEALGQRQAAGQRSLVLGPAARPRQLEKRERVAGGLPATRGSVW